MMGISCQNKVKVGALEEGFRTWKKIIKGN